MTILQEGDGAMAGVPVTDRGAWMQMPEGRIFYPLDPQPEDVFIEDIALGLSRCIRYNGLSDEWIAVAQHSVQCEYLAKRDGHTASTRLVVLMHDAPEYIVGDMIRPIKCQMPDFKRVENKIEAVIWEALGLPEMNAALHETIKYYDNLAWAWEKRDLFKSAREWPYTPELPRDLPRMVTWSHEYSRKRFMTRYWHLACAVSNQEWKIR